jgi:ABC-type phosphate/phosphonate transport system substrate-binding protein
MKSSFSISFRRAAAMSVVMASFAAYASDAVTNVFRMGVSSASFGQVNRNDANAALKAWSVSVSKERNLKQHVEVQLFDTEGDLLQAMARGEMDAATLIAESFMRVLPAPDVVLLPARHGLFTEQYVLLVHRDSGLVHLNDLKGRKLVRHDSPRTSLAQPWLENLLASNHLAGAREFMSEITAVETPSKAVLRVFFHQSDVCLVSSNAFAIACALNPQVRRDLAALAVSPPVVPAMLYFNNGYDPAAREEIEDAILNLYSTVAGAQVLTIFQADQFVKVTPSALAGTRQLVAEYTNLHPTGSLTPSAASPATQQKNKVP